MPPTTVVRRTIASLGLASVVVVLTAMPVLGVDTVTQVVSAGTRSASVADVTLAAVNYSHSAQNNTGSMTLTADDSSATGAGWNVTVQSSAFVYSGANGGTNIPAANFSITSAAAPTMTAGQAIDATGGPNVPASGSTGALNVARKTIQADVGFGQGTYTQGLNVSLNIPAQSRAGTYTGTLTVTISAGP
jgi:hypothetical protein